MPRLNPVARFAWLGLIAAAALGQDVSSLPRFELASIRLNTSSDPSSRNDFSGGYVVFRNYVLSGILQNAFHVDRLNLQAPDWMFSERFDITAKVPDENASYEQRCLMLQALFIDRFGLAFHKETKMRAGYALAIAADGPKIHPVPDVGGHNNDNHPGRIERLRTNIGDFANALSSVLRQPVVDETHMEGLYNILLTYAPDRGPDSPPPADEGPSIFTALKEELGLKLEPRKLPVTVFVVDRCQKLPTDN